MATYAHFWRLQRTNKPPLGHRSVIRWCAFVWGDFNARVDLVNKQRNFPFPSKLSWAPFRGRVLVQSEPFFPLRSYFKQLTMSTAICPRPWVVRYIFRGDLRQPANRFDPQRLDENELLCSSPFLIRHTFFFFSMPLHQTEEYCSNSEVQVH